MYAILQEEILAIEGLVNMEFASQINSKEIVAKLLPTVQLDIGVQLNNANLLFLQEVLVLLYQL